MPGFSGDLNRYIYSYEAGWWTCVERYAKDIDHKANDGDRMGNGWPSEVGGYWDGSTDCERRVRKIIDMLGKPRAQKVFEQSLHMPS